MGDETQYDNCKNVKKNGGFMYEQKSKENRSYDAVGVAGSCPFGADYCGSFSVTDENEIEPRLTTSYYLAVETIEQINDFWCCAACGASVVNWMTGDDELQSEFCLTCTGSTADITLPLGTLKNKLYIYYDVTSIFKEMDSGYSNIQEAPPLLSLYQIKQNIDSGKPILANLYHWDSEQGHCVVINGYTYNDVLGTGTIKYMDPSVGRYVDMPYDAFCSNSAWIWLETLYSLEYIG